ncbi:MAG: matrixin family metalloprotease [Smithella sp.]
MSNLPGKTCWKFFVFLLLILISATFFLRTTKPCRETKTYRIGKVDERFVITREQFAQAVNMAADMWGKSLGKELFREDSQGAIEINLVYDYRQEASEKLKKLDYKIDNTRASYEDLKTRLQNLKMEYDQKNSSLANDLTLHNSRINAFNANMEYWNRQGAIPDNVYIKLTQEKNALDSLRETFKLRQDELKQSMDTINSMVIVINEIAARINVDTADYHNMGDALGREFCEGYYEVKDGKQTINIYQFDNDYRLVRVLAHELGHALGLKHSTDPDAVMYRLVRSDIANLSSDDVAALQKRCNANSISKR